MRPAYPMLDFSLLRDLQGVIYLDPEIPDSALQLRVPEQKLNSPQILRPFVD